LINPETSDICLDTPDLTNPETPGIGLDTSVISAISSLEFDDAYDDMIHLLISLKLA
jgi:hypothetical protein